MRWTSFLEKVSDKLYLNQNLLHQMHTALSKEFSITLLYLYEMSHIIRIQFNDTRVFVSFNFIEDTNFCKLNYNWNGSRRTCRFIHKQLF